MVGLLKISFNFLLLSLARASSNTRIINGDLAVDKNIPYMVSLRINNYHFCGGSVLNKFWVLTAAHCLENYLTSPVTVVVGTAYLDKGGVHYEAIKMINHPQYSKATVTLIGCDIGLIKVKKEIQFGPNVQPVKISTSFASGAIPVTLSGWGIQSVFNKSPSTELYTLSTKTYNQLLCRLLLIPLPVPQSVVCTYSPFGKGICLGDSGSALVTEDGVQIGIASLVIPCGVGMPDMYTRVSYFVSWIKETIENN